MKFGLRKADLLEILQVLYAHKAVEEVWLFGSRAMGNYRNGSDIDIALKGKDITHNTIIQLQVSLDDLWLPYYFDLLHYDSLKDEAVKVHIDKYGVYLERPFHRVSRQ